VLTKLCDEKGEILECLCGGKQDKRKGSWYWGEAESVGQAHLMWLARLHYMGSSMYITECGIETGG
jgi:hypothetical protein